MLFARRVTLLMLCSNLAVFFCSYKCILLHKVLVMADIRNLFHMVTETWYMWQQHVIFCAETSYIWCRLVHVIFVGIRMLYLVL